MSQTFSRTFQSPYQQYRHLIGLPVTVLSETTEADPDIDEGCGPMYDVLVTHPDGQVERIAAWPEEVDLRVIADVAIRQGVPYVEAVKG